MNLKRVGLILISIGLFVGLYSFGSFYTILFWESNKADIEIRLFNIHFTKEEINIELYTEFMRAFNQIILFNKNTQVS